MDQDTFSIWFLVAAIAWIMVVIGISVAFRRRKGRPVFPTVPDGAIYVDKSASGRWANNCLFVVVTHEAVSVVPKFPFNLMFLPEIYGLERTIPVSSIGEVRQLRGFRLGNNVSVAYGKAELRLRVRDSQAFVDALAAASLPT